MRFKETQPRNVFLFTSSYLGRLRRGEYQGISFPLQLRRTTADAVFAHVDSQSKAATRWSNQADM